MIDKPLGPDDDLRILAFLQAERRIKMCREMWFSPGQFLLVLIPRRGYHQLCAERGWTAKR